MSAAFIQARQIAALCLRELCRGHEDASQLERLERRSETKGLRDTAPAEF